ncbi:multidrug effflux MFS transporter [Lutimaribacter marinistellae]|uniref:Bcr/CflA family efflux transporter n=1 Tax=Lutimaribacter marinistellae TaxID=1820329 RepID=A0ABV7TL77_9RHOB
MRPAKTPPHLVTLILGSALGVLSLNMFLPSLARMAEDFDVEYGLVNLSVAGYLAMTAVLQLLIGPLSDRFGRRPVLLSAMAIFVLASIGCALASSIWVFLLFRMMQGVVIAASVVSLAIVRDMYPPAEAASRLGYIGMSMALAPMLGPMLGGALDMAFGWRASFVFYTLAGLAVLGLIWFDLGETSRRASQSLAQQLSELPELAASRRFRGYVLCLGFSVGGFYTFITGAPLVAAAWFDLVPAQLGLGIGIITGGFMVGNLVTGRMATRTDPLNLVLAGRCSAVLGPFLGLGAFLLGQGSVLVFFGAAILLGLGNGLTLASVNAGLVSVRPHLAGSASGLSGAFTVALGAVLTSGVGVLVTPENAPFAVLGTMLVTSTTALIASLYVRRIERLEGAPGPA